MVSTTLKETTMYESESVAHAGGTGGPQAEPYECMRVSRSRAYVLALAAWPIAGLALAGYVFEKATEQYVPPVVLTIDANNHVAKSEIGTPAVLGAKEAIVYSEIANYVKERYTLDRRFRDDHIQYVRLHSSTEVVDRFNHEMDAKNKSNPYYSIPETAVRRVKDVRVRILDLEKRKAEATFSTWVDGSGDPTPTYWHILLTYDFVKQGLTPQDRYINGTGWTTTAFEDNTEPAPPMLNQRL
jgi:type IV secretory pathway component VirB8